MRALSFVPRRTIDSPCCSCTFSRPVSTLRPRPKGRLALAKGESVCKQPRQEQLPPPLDGSFAAPHAPEVHRVRPSREPWLLAALAGLMLPAAQAQCWPPAFPVRCWTPSGAVLPGATLTLTNKATGVIGTVKSNGAGFYNFSELPPGDYSVVVTASGVQDKQHDRCGAGRGDASQPECEHGDRGRAWSRSWSAPTRLPR